MAEGEGHHGHHHHKVKIPDYRIYKVEDAPELVKVKDKLSDIGLKDPWLRNYVWQYLPNIITGITPKRRALSFVSRGFKTGAGLFIASVLGEIAWEKIKEGNGNHRKPPSEGGGGGHGSQTFEEIILPPSDKVCPPPNSVKLIPENGNLKKGDYNLRTSDQNKQRSDESSVSLYDFSAFGYPFAGGANKFTEDKTQPCDPSQTPDSFKSTIQLPDDLQSPNSVQSSNSSQSSTSTTSAKAITEEVEEKYPALNEYDEIDRRIDKAIDSFIALKIHIPETTETSGSALSGKSSESKKSKESSKSFKKDVLSGDSVIFVPEPEEVLDYFSPDASEESASTEDSTKDSSQRHHDHYES